MAARRLGGDAACWCSRRPRNPGGGFLGGAKAQEEGIARASALYACLLTAPEFYAFHRDQRDLRYSDRVIYSPGVPVFRDDKGRLLDRPYRAAFLTAAAPNLGAILRNQPEHAADVPAVLRRRAQRVLRVAAAHGHRTLVLGSLGLRRVPQRSGDSRRPPSPRRCARSTGSTGSSSLSTTVCAAHRCTRPSNPSWRRAATRRNSPVQPPTNPSGARIRQASVTSSVRRSASTSASRSITSGKPS